MLLKRRILVSHLTNPIEFDLILRWEDILRRWLLLMMINVLELENPFLNEVEMLSMLELVLLSAMDWSMHIQWVSEEEMFFSSIPSQFVCRSVCWTCIRRYSASRRTGQSYQIIERERAPLRFNRTIFSSPSHNSTETFTGEGTIDKTSPQEIVFLEKEGLRNLIENNGTSYLLFKSFGDEQTIFEYRIAPLHSTAPFILMVFRFVVNRHSGRIARLCWSVSWIRWWSVLVESIRGNYSFVWRRFPSHSSTGIRHWKASRRDSSWSSTEVKQQIDLSLCVDWIELLRVQRDLRKEYPHEWSFPWRWSNDAKEIRSNITSNSCTRNWSILSRRLGSIGRRRNTKTRFSTRI